MRSQGAPHRLVLLLLLSGGTALSHGPSAGVARAAGEPVPLRLRLTLELGGEVFGEVLDHSERLIVLDYRGFPCAFAFDELEVASAYQARRRLLSAAGGGAGGLTAEDHYRLGRYALSRDHPVLASREFRAALRLDPDLDDRIRAARRRFAERRDPTPPRSDDREPEGTADPGRIEGLPDLAETVGRADGLEQQRATELYRRFGRLVQQHVNPDLVLLETEHFLLWTDWEPRHRDHLAALCERMYAGVGSTLGVSAEATVFPGKCPVFCFRSRGRFLAFARTVDGWRQRNVNGYVRRASNGYVHVALFRRGTDPAALDRFAATLVHEGTHAFVHGCGGAGNIPGWLNEGLAEYVSEVVLGERCLAGEAASMVARQYVLRDLPIRDLLRRPGTPQPHEYPVAHSLVRFLFRRSPDAFAAFLAECRGSPSVERALQEHYGMTLAALEAAWQDAVRAASPATR